MDDRLSSRKLSRILTTSIGTTTEPLPTTSTSFSQMASNGTPTANRKRALSPDDDASPSVTAKRLKFDKSNSAAPSPVSNGLGAIASAISGVFGFASQANGASKPQSPAPAPSTQPSAANAPILSPQKLPYNPMLPQPGSPSPTKFRPAIKLAALRGTKWDDGSIPPAKKASPKKAPTPRKPKAAASPNKTPSKRTPGRPPGSALKNATNPEGEPDGVYDDFDELASPSKGATPGKPAGAKRLFDNGTPKGILTPSKRKPGRPPKNVKFNSRLDDEVYFEDAKKTPGRPRKTPLKVIERREEPEPEPEILCGICAKGHSNPPNEIILCDNCDFAVHQECYDVSEIPTGEWLCKSCTQEDPLLKTPKKAGEQVVKAVDVPDIPNLDVHVRSMQRVLLDRCTGHRPISMFGQEEARAKVQHLLEQTVVAGEGNSMLLIGARGSGKTTMVEGIISDLSAEHKQDFHVVRLNGFIHTDDKLALKEIWRQLGKEMEVEDDLININNYADTMTSLLALLSHPSEISAATPDTTSQSIIFTIDEFDMFAAHPRQTLLYNLFDIAQSRKAPIAVLGATTRLDVVEMLEKRVKSRFSHRYVYLTLPRGLPMFWQYCKQGLVLEKPEAKREGVDVELEGYDEFRSHWNTKIEDMYKDKAFQKLLQYHFYTSKSHTAFFAEWITALASISAADLTLTIPPAASADGVSLNPPDSRIHLLTTLSELDLGLLIAAARLDIIAHTDTVNFAMAYDEYSSLVGRQRLQSASSGMLAVGGGVRAWSRGVAGIAWERLISLGLLVPAGIGGGRVGYGGLEGKMWKIDVALEEIPSAVKLNAVLAKWCSQI